MGQERFWLLGVTVAATICFLCPSVVPQVVTGRVGGSAELGCSLIGASDGTATPNLFPLHVVEWVRLGYNVPILIKFGGYTPRVHPNYKGRVSLTRGASLHVDGLTLDDEGWFECRILLLDRTTDEFRNGTWTFLSVTAPPVFIKTPPAFVEVLLGESLTLSCGAHGNPKPSVTWRKNDNMVEKHDKVEVLNGTLSLAKVTRETAGMYKCHVFNSEGNLTHITQLQVKGPPVILISPEDTTMNMSQDAILQCQADAYPSNLTYEWWKEGQNVYHIESLKSRVKILVDGTLLIPGLIPEDSGNYTCIPTNGLLTPPAASAYLKVKHPARVVRMPRETYLPVGMGGKIVCPVEAEPPMLYVNWTKDGNSLDLDQFPGWMVNSEGSVFIATANDDAVGMYTCTPYNSYGTMGQSEPTKVVLEDPPTFQVSPRAEYLQEVGRELIIPCQAHGDPSPNITWTKVGAPPRSPFTILNGSLVLRPLSKDHQGAWECHATNRVATISTGTLVLVLGTTPHAVTAVSVDPGMNHANVSWEPGFDGGYTQKFTVWVKPTTRGKHEWTSLPVPTSKSSLLVTGLQAATSYQFSVLPQNKLGSGPFSEIVTIRTFAPPTDPPTVVTTVATIPPPYSLSVNCTAAGVLLQWSPPPVESPPITVFVLQARQEKGEWVTLDEAININITEMIVQGLMRDSTYELRLLSRRDKMISGPSESVSVSTKGMEMYPAPPSLLAFVPEPLLAGVIGGVCFLFVAIVLSLVTACVMSHRRERRRRKRQDDIPSAFQKSPSPQARSLADSPDSLLKMKLCPPLNFFPNSSSSDRSDRSSFDKGSRSEYQDQKKQLLSSSSPPPRYTLFESHLGGSLSPTSAIESISRGPDGRFIVQPYPEGSTPMHIKKSLKKEFPQSPGRGSGPFRDSPKSNSVRSGKDARQVTPSGLTVDTADPERPQHSPGRVKAMARNFSRHGCFYSDEEQGCSEGLLERTSFYSDCSENRGRDSLRKYRLPSHRDDIFPSLNRRARALERERLLHQGGYQPMDRDSQLTEPSTMVSQLGGEQEGDNLSKCLRLAKEREEMERELESYTFSRRAQEHEIEHRRAKSASPLRRWTGAESEDPIWKPQDIQLRQKAQRPSSLAQRVSDYRRGCYFGNTSSPMEKLLPCSSYVQWNISPVTSPTNQVPMQSLSEGNTPRSLQPDTSQRGLLAAEDSVARDFSRSPVTQCTSLSFLSPKRNNPSPCGSDLGKTRIIIPERHTEREHELSHSKTLAEEGWKQDRAIEAQVSRSASPAPCCPQSSKMAFERAQHSIAERERNTSPHNHYPKLSTHTQETNINHRGKLNHSPSGCSTLPYDHQKTGVKVKGESKTENELSSSSLQPEGEKEGVRARSRKSDKCVFSDSPNRISPLTLENELESDQSNFSIVRMSESSKPKIVAQPARVSPLQTSTILEYLSLPGFIEMSVDEPIEESQPTESTWPSAEPENSTLLRHEPDVVPKNWESHGQDNSEGNEISDSHQSEVLVDDLKPSPIPENESKSKPCTELVYRDVSIKSESSETNGGIAQVVSHEGKSSQPLLSQKRLDSDNLAQTLVSTAKGLAKAVFDSPQQGEGIAEFSSEPSQRSYIQNNRTNKITSRISQAPMPFIKKSISIGPCRTLSGMGQPRPFLKKSISLGSQRWEHYESPRTYVSETCYRDELPHPDVRVQSYSLGRTPASSYSRPGPSWQGPVPFQPSLNQQPYMSPSYVSHAYRPQVLDPPKLTEAHRHESDPRRQAAVFPEPSRCPLSYRETLRSIQHKYVPQDFPHPFRPPRPVLRGDYIRSMDYRGATPRPFLPRGYSWPSPYQTAFPSRDHEVHLELYRGCSADGEGRDRAEAGRASYASQSSGRGSVGPYGHGHIRQSVSITPTLMSSPETTEENERHKAEVDLREQRSKR